MRTRWRLEHRHAWLGALVAGLAACPIDAQQAEDPPESEPTEPSEDRPQDYTDGPLPEVVVRSIVSPSSVALEPFATRIAGGVSAMGETLDRFFDPDSPHSWAWEVEPTAWYVAPGGEVEIGSAGMIDVGDLNVDSPGFAPQLEAHGRVGYATLSFRGSLIDASGLTELAAPVAFGTQTFGAGATVDTDFSLNTADLRLGWRLHEYRPERPEGRRSRVAARLEAIGGVRLYDFDLEVTGVGATTGAADLSITTAQPLAGLRYAIEIDDAFRVKGEVTVGGLPEINGVSSRSTDIMVALGYRPVHNVGAQIGYRLRTTSLESDDGEYDGAVAGLFAGLVIRH